MLADRVRENFPLVRLILPGSDGSSFEVEFVVDTGFDGELALPPEQIARLNAAPAGERTSALADRSLRRHRLFETALDWFGEDRPTEVLELEGNPLIGMQLLQGWLLHVEVTEGGEVNIEPM